MVEVSLQAAATFQFQNGSALALGVFSAFFNAWKTFLILLNLFGSRFPRVCT
jgi:hypothetical protein